MTYDEDPFGLPELPAERVSRVEPHKDVTRDGPVRYYHRLVQGCDEWLALRRGMITASIMDRFLTPTLKVSSNEKTRTAVFDLAAQRITGRSEDNFTSYDMERGKLEEVTARKAYSEAFAPVAECGFIINDSLGFDLGFSPDGLVGDDGLIEVKSRMAKYQVQTIVEHMGDKIAPDTIPSAYVLQIQTGLFVTGREWCDFVSFSNGVSMAVIRCYPDPQYQDAIRNAAERAEESIQRVTRAYRDTMAARSAHILPVEWVDYHDSIMGEIEA